MRRDLDQVDVRCGGLEVQGRVEVDQSRLDVVELLVDLPHLDDPTGRRKRSIRIRIEIHAPCRRRGSSWGLGSRRREGEARTWK